MKPHLVIAFMHKYDSQIKMTDFQRATRKKHDKIKRNIIIINAIIIKLEIRSENNTSYVFAYYLSIL